MTRSQIVKKNIELSGKFSNYIMKNPKVASKISARASIIVIPRNDKILEAENRKFLKNYCGRKDVYIAKEIVGGWAIEACVREKAPSKYSK